jgi:hypothetical protein
MEMGHDHRHLYNLGSQEETLNGGRPEMKGEQENVRSV